MRIPSSLRSKIHSGPVKRSWVNVAAIGTTHSGKDVGSSFSIRLIFVYSNVNAQLHHPKRMGTAFVTSRNGRIEKLQRRIHRERSAAQTVRHRPQRGTNRRRSTSRNQMGLVVHRVALGKRKLPCAWDRGKAYERCGT